MPQGWTLVQPAPQAEPQGWTPVASASAPKPAEKSWLDSSKDYLGEALQSLNPSGINAGIQRAFWHPIDTIGGMGQAQGDLKEKAEKSFKEGDYATGVRHVLSYLIPVLGPRLDQASDLIQQGEIAKGLGATTDVAIQAFGPKVLKDAVPATTRALVPNKNPVEAEAVAFGQRNGIPVDAATATGNPFVRGTQKLADQSLGGSVTGQRAQAAQAQGLATVGEQLAAKVHPNAVTTEQAGQAVREGVTASVHKAHGEASIAYERLRKMEDDPRNTTTVGGLDKVALDDWASNVKKTHPDLSVLNVSLTKSGDIRLDTIAVVNSGKGVGTSAMNELTKLADANGRRITVNLAEKGYSPVEGAATTSPKRLEDFYKRFGFVSNKGRAKDFSITEAMYRDPASPGGPSAGGIPTSDVKMAVDLTASKAALKPTYDTLKREAELVPLVGDKARALTSLDRLLTGPDYAPLSVVDAALGELKTFARAANPDMRTIGQGKVHAAIQNLDLAVRQAAERAGPEAVRALHEGRQATIAKYVAADVLDTLNAEPVRTAKGLTAPGDSAFQKLRAVAQQAPQSVPQIARSVLDGFLEKATERGGFQHADKLYADWQKLGDGTKALLYKDPAYIKDLDNFFLLAKKLAENPNPSGSALTLAKGGELSLLISNPIAGAATSVSAMALSKLLHSPLGVKLLTKGLVIPARSGAATVYAAELSRAIGGLEGSMTPAFAGDPGARKQ